MKQYKCNYNWLDGKYEYFQKKITNYYTENECNYLLHRSIKMRNNSINIEFYNNTLTHISKLTLKEGNIDR